MGYVSTVFPGAIGESFKESFEEAADFWNAVITTGHSGYTVSSNFNVQRWCGTEAAATIPAGTKISGLQIYAEIYYIDGVGSILGAAGPCLLQDEMPAVGIMRFDSADSQSLLDDGSFTEVIIHEMGHVIGIGSLWSRMNLVRNPCTSYPCTADPIYLGENGLEGYADLDGEGSLLVANTGTAGTYNAHWREVTFENELMTGYLNSGMPNPLSIMSIKSMIDLGYGVDTSAAEEYLVPSELQRPFAGEQLEMFGDVLEFDMIDFKEADAEMARISKSSVTSHRSEFTGSMLTIVVGFLAVAMMMLHFYSKQKKLIQEAASGAAKVPASPVVKREKYIEP